MNNPETPRTIDLRASGTVVERRGVKAEVDFDGHLPDVVIGPRAESAKTPGMTFNEMRIALPRLREAKARFRKHLDTCAECGALKQAFPGLLKIDLYLGDCQDGRILMMAWAKLREPFGDQIKGDDACLL